jgi:hypothetical protein
LRLLPWLQLRRRILATNERPEVGCPDHTTASGIGRLGQPELMLRNRLAVGRRTRVLAAQLSGNLRSGFCRPPTAKTETLVQIKCAIFGCRICRRSTPRLPVALIAPALISAYHQENANQEHAGAQQHDRASDAGAAAGGN